MASTQKIQYNAVLMTTICGLPVVLHYLG